MSLYIPRSAVVKENLRQITYRFKLEAKHKDAIKGFQELLKTKSTVVPQIMSLGFTKPHATALEMRLQFQNEVEARKQAEKAAKEAKLAELNAKKENPPAEPFLTSPLSSDNRESQEK